MLRICKIGKYSQFFPPREEEHSFDKSFFSEKYIVREDNASWGGECPRSRAQSLKMISDVKGVQVGGRHEWEVGWLWGPPWSKREEGDQSHYCAVWMWGGRFLKRVLKKFCHVLCTIRPLLFLLQESRKTNVTLRFFTMLTIKTILSWVPDNQDFWFIKFLIEINQNS